MSLFPRAVLAFVFLVAIQGVLLQTSCGICGERPPRYFSALNRSGGRRGSVARSSRRTPAPSWPEGSSERITLRVSSSGRAGVST